MTAYNGHQATKQVTEQVVGGGADWGSRHLNGFDLDCKPPIDGRLLPLQMRRRTGAFDPAQPRSARLGGGDDSGKGGEGQHWAGRSSPVRSSLGAPRKAQEAPATPIPPMGTMHPLSGPKRGSRAVPIIAHRAPGSHGYYTATDITRLAVIRSKLQYNTRRIGQLSRQIQDRPRACSSSSGTSTNPAGVRLKPARP